MKVDQVRDSVNCRVDEMRYFVKIVDVVRVDQVRVDQVGCSHGPGPGFRKIPLFYLLKKEPSTHFNQFEAY